MRTPIVILCVHPGRSPEQATGESCQENIRLLHGAPSIATLPVKEGAKIIEVVLPGLMTLEARYDIQNMTPEQLSSVLRYQQLAIEASGERIIAMTYQDPTGCGNHG